MLDRERFIAQVKVNCDISDAMSWGYYSICGLFMRMRELYRSEHSLMPWEDIPRQEMSDWITSKERLWERLSGETLRPLEIDGERFDPFQTDELNSVLNSRGLLYGAGYGLFNKPTFFLAVLQHIRWLYDYKIYYAGKELCRDLSSPSAVLQGNCIFVRTEQIGALLWEKFQELKARRYGGFLSEAFSHFGISGSEELSEDLIRKISTLSSGVAELLVLHEIGEAFEDEHADEWLSLLGRDADKWTELHLRGIKDILADTSIKGPLKYVADVREKPLLVFYVALMDGIRKELFPEVLNAFATFSEGGDWSVIERARLEGYEKARRLRSRIILASRLEGEEGVRKFLRAMKERGWVW